MKAGILVAKLNVLVVSVFVLSAVDAHAQCCPHSKRAAVSQSDIVETASNAGQFNTLLTAATQAGLVEALKGEGPLTVFAPTDEAFAKLPKGTVENLLKPENKQQLKDILTYHVVAGKLPAKKVLKSNGIETLNGQRVEFKSEDGKVLIDKAQIVKTDIRAKNGIIHVIDQVILPSSENLVVTAKNAKSFNTLLTAAKKAGLAEILAEGGPFTIFAPTDEAFGKLPEGTIENLLKPENKQQLADILKYHVVSGRVFSDQAIEAGEAKTLKGQKIRIRLEKDNVFVNEARVVSADLDASNGVIHVVDTVILPKQPVAELQ